VAQYVLHPEAVKQVAHPVPVGACLQDNLHLFVKTLDEVRDSGLFVLEALALDQLFTVLI